MKQIRLHAFDMACVGHIQQGLWTHPGDQATAYASLDHWIGLARTLERGLFDGLFLADVMGVYDVFGGSADAAVEAGVQVPLLDPMLLVPAMAAATKHLGFAVTANLGFEAPYVFARRMSTLDHLTRGRIGWNIVTGYLDSAARAVGRDGQVAHDDRYDIADEFLGVVRRLWEESWEDGAVLADRSTGRYADPARVHRIVHAGRHYRMDGIHLCAPSPQRTPVLYQAGASDRGRLFAAAHAECVFVNGTSMANVARIVGDLHAEAQRLGRPEGWPRVFMGATVVTAATGAEAEARCAEYEAYADSNAALVQAAGSMGIDFAAMEPDQPIPSGPGQAVASNLEAITRFRQGPAMTPDGLLRSMRLGGRQIPIVGSPGQVADALQDWMAQTGIDGFMLARTVTPACLEDFVALVVPVLQARGAYKLNYQPGTLREKLG